jgi:pilus assembly protein CpaE
MQSLPADRRLMRSRVAAHTGGLPGAIQYLAQNEAPQIVMIEAVEIGDALFTALEKLAEVCDPKLKVVLIGWENDISLYKKLTGMGLADYYCGPMNADILIGLIDNQFVEASDKNLGRVISFIGARGGVGSSTVALNTAHTLGRLFGEKTILLDLDLAFGSAALACNLNPRQNMSEALAEPHRLDDVMMERFLLNYDDNLSLVPAPAALDDSGTINFEAFQVLLNLVKRIAGYVVLDLPHRWDRAHQEILLDSNEIVVTAYPDLVNLRDVKNIFEKIGPARGVDAPIRLVFNKVGLFKKGELTAKDYKEAVEVEPAASIAYDTTQFGTALTNGVVLNKVAKNSKAAREIDRLAQLVSGRAMPVKKTGGLWRKRAAG